MATINPWIIAHDGRGEKPFGFECERCGCFKNTALPMPVPKFIEACREFTDKHKHCPEVAV